MKSLLPSENVNGIGEFSGLISCANQQELSLHWQTVPTKIQKGITALKINDIYD